MSKLKNTRYSVVEELSKEIRNLKQNMVYTQGFTTRAFLYGDQNVSSDSRGNLFFFLPSDNKNINSINLSYIMLPTRYNDNNGSIQELPMPSTGSLIVGFGKDGDALSEVDNRTISSGAGITSLDITSGFVGLGSWYRVQFDVGSNKKIRVVSNISIRTFLE